MRKITSQKEFIESSLGVKTNEERIEVLENEIKKLKNQISLSTTAYTQLSEHLTALFAALKVQGLLENLSISK